MTAPERDHYGYQLSRESGVRSGVLYPTLQRLLDNGWLRDGWEQIDPKVEKRPPRRYYRLTDVGARELGALAQTATRTAAHGSRVSFA